MAGTLRSAGITQRMFTDMTIGVCVRTLMREANDRGYQCLLVEDGTEGYFRAFMAATLTMITEQGARRLAYAQRRSAARTRLTSAPHCNGVPRQRTPPPLRRAAPPASRRSRLAAVSAATMPL